MEGIEVRKPTKKVRRRKASGEAMITGTGDNAQAVIVTKKQAATPPAEPTAVQTPAAKTSTAKKAAAKKTAEAKKAAAAPVPDSKTA